MEQGKLQVAQADTVRKALDLGDPTADAGAKASDPELDKKAQAYVDALLSMNAEDFNARESGKAAVESMGATVQRDAAKQSELLKRPLKELMKRGQDGGDVAKSLIDLKVRVEDLDPGNIDLEPGWMSRTLGMIPGVGTPLKRYFSRWESAQTVISAIIRSLENGRDQLERDSLTLAEDQKRMRELTKKLEKAIQLGMIIDKKLEASMTSLEAGSDKQRFVAEELLFPLRQRIMDLQQQLAVNQQGVVASEIIVRNNKELVRGVNRALNVTVNALQVGVTVAVALANQKAVLDKVDSVNKTTSDLLASTAKRIKTQGTAIHRQAASSSISIDSLKSAFADLNSAMTDLSEFRSNALPQMAQSVLELDQITAEAAKAIKRMEEGNKARPSISIDV